MSETPAIYSSLPEDLEPLPAPRVYYAAATLTVRIGSNAIALTRGAYEAIGKPRRVEILFGRTSRMLAVRPTETHGRVVSGAGNGSTLQIAYPSPIASFGLPPVAKGTTHRFVAQLVEGALLIGPLPEADE